MKRKGQISRSKNPDSKRYKKDMANYLNDRLLKCVTERNENGAEVVIGRSGQFHILGKDFLIYSGEKVLFRCPILQMSAWELMSHDGVTVTGPDEEHGGAPRTVVAYYLYWRPIN